jgi:hypothetical protein
MNWVFREQPVLDYGIDAYIEEMKKEENYASGRLVALQLKTGPSHLKEENNSHYVYRGKNKYLRYWLRYSLPVIVVLCDPKNEVCYWQHIREDTIVYTDCGWKVEIPKNQLFDWFGAKLLHEIADNMNEYQRRFNTLLLHRPWIQAAALGFDVIVESEEYINKSSGIGSMRVYVYDQEMNIKSNDVTWPMIAFPEFTTYKDLFAMIFPWANIEIDAEYYYEFELERYELTHYYGKERGAFSEFWDDFRE